MYSKNVSYTPCLQTIWKTTHIKNNRQNNSNRPKHVRDQQVSNTQQYFRLDKVSCIERSQIGLADFVVNLLLLLKPHIQMFLFLLTVAEKLTHNERWRQYTIWWPDIVGMQDQEHGKDFYHHAQQRPQLGKCRGHQQGRSVKYQRHDGCTPDMDVIYNWRRKRWNQTLLLNILMAILT